MAELASAPSIGFGIGLSGKPKEFENVALQRLKQTEPPKIKSTDLSKFIKLDFNKYHPVVQQEALDISNDLFDYMQQKQSDPANKYTNWSSTPEFQRKLAETKLKLGKLEGESRRIGEGIKEYMTNKDKDVYEINPTSDSILANAEGLDSPTLNKAYRGIFGGDYSADKHFAFKGKPFDVSQDINKNGLPQIKEALVSQGYATLNDDGTISTTTTKKITPEVIENIGKNLLSNEKRLNGVKAAYDFYVKNNPEEELKYNGAQDWYIKQQLAPFVKNQTISRLTGKGERSLRNLGDGQYTNNDFNYTFVKEGVQSDTQKLYQDYLGQIAEANKERETPVAPLPFEDYLQKYESVFGRGGKKLVFTRNDKATENKELTFKSNNGDLIKGVPLGIAEENGDPFVVVSVPSQKMITKTVKDAFGNQQVINVPEKYVEKLVPFKGENQGKVFSEYRGASEAIKGENPEWLQVGIKVSTPAPRVKTSTSKPIALSGKINPATLVNEQEYDIGGKIYKWNGSKLIAR